MPNILRTTKLRLFIFSVFILFTASTLTIGCADEPGSLGKDFLNPNDTEGVRVFDSYVDTMQITSAMFKRYVNTSISNNLMIGINGTYNSKSLIRFNDVNSNYDSATVTSAVLTLTYRNYYFPVSSTDSLGQISFDAYSVLKNLDYGTATLDSVNSSSFGTTSRGTYTGNPTADTQRINVTLDNQLVKDWLEYAADTSYSVKNYGVALIPNASSNVLKGFYSINAGSDVKPKVTVIVTKNGDTDTLTLDNTSSLFMTDATITPGAETFSIQGAISYGTFMNFDLSKIPSTATINDAQVFLTLDAGSSALTQQSINKVAFLFVTDTAGPTVEPAAFELAPHNGSSTQYVVRIIAPFQRWLQGTTNFGVTLTAYSHRIALDLFTFFNMNATDPTKRPRVIIKYTPRITP